MDNKNTIIIAVCAACLLLTIIISCSRGCGKPSKKTTTGFSQSETSSGKTTTKKTKEQEDYGFPTGSYSGGGSHGSGGGYVPDYSSMESDNGAPPALLSADDKAEMLKFNEEEAKRLQEEAEEWLSNKLKDKSLSAKTIEQYKLKQNQNFNNGMVARYEKNYERAIKEFNEILKDDTATSITKYFALYNLMSIAQELGDLDLFFIAARMRGKLVAEEDLSVIGLEKTNSEIIWAQEAELALKAKDSNDAFEKLVALKIEKFKGNLDRATAEASAKKSIKKYTKLFKDFIE